MAKISDLVSQAVRDLTAQLKQIKDADEEDLAKLASSFDRLAQRADETAGTLGRADAALGGQDGDAEGKADEEAQAGRSVAEEEQKAK